MPSVDREASRDRESRHQHSYSETGRVSVPMWDSSDPDRCPPPLPIPPGSSGLQTKPNTSAAIQAAAHKLHERARESLSAAYLANISPSSSPERSLIKGATHRRMQSAHASNAKDLKTYLDGVRSGSPERSATGAAAEYYSSPSSRPDTPTRASPRPILGENTPPSATMRALQTMVVKDEPVIADITNGRVPAPNDEVAVQLSKLTNIATSLQEEMASLTRRSKDNAADLLGLKEAAKNRDDDIRKNLRDLMSSPTFGAPSSPLLNRSGGFGLGLLDNKAFGSPTQLPRAASHNNIHDADRIGSPNPFSVEGAANMAMLEKIIRDMVTKEGQERLLSNLSELVDKSSKMSKEAVAKVNDLSDFIKTTPKGQMNGALVRTGPQDTPVPGDLKDILKKIRDSVTTSGGLTAEIKALIRELRGEILGMGRELGRKLDEAGAASNSRQPHEDPARSHAEMHNIVNESIGGLRNHMEKLIAEAARQSSSLIQTRGETSNDDMYAMVKHALVEHDETLAQSRGGVDFDKEELLNTVRAACDNFKPEIELQQYGLEREEILEVLKEGLAEYRSSTDGTPASAASKQEVVDAMHEALQSVQLPQPMLDTHAIKAEMLASIRECLEEFRSANPEVLKGSLEDGATRDLISDAIRGGLAEHADTTSRVMEISRDDLFDAVKAGLDGSSIPFGGFGEQVLQQLHELVDGMKLEFRQYSAASGRDTEQVLDAVKDGLEVLRGQIETYVDRAQDVTGKDEIIDTIRTSLDNLREDIKVGGSPQGFSTEVLEAIRGEFENLQSHIHRTGGSRADTEEMLDTIRLGLDDLRSHVDKKMETPEKHLLNGEILDTLNEGLENLRSDLTKTLERPVDMTVSYEILDTLKEGLAGLRADMEKLSPSRARAASAPNGSGQIVLADSADLTNDTTLPASNSTHKADFDKVEVMIAQLQIKIEAMDRNIQDMPASSMPAESTGKEHLVGLEEMLKNIQTAVAELASKSSPDGETLATKADTNAIETLLRNTKSQIEDLNLPSADMAVTRDQMDSVEAVARVAKESIDALVTKVEENIATKADVAVVEVLAVDVKSALEELSARTRASSEDEADRISKADLDVLGVICTEIKDKVLSMVLPEVETFPDKADIEQLHGLVNDLRDGHEKFRETYDKDITVTAQAFDDRRKDTEEIVQSVAAIKVLLEEFKQDSSDREEANTTTMDEVNEILTGIQGKIESHPEVATDVKSIIETVKTEFEKAHSSLQTLHTTYDEHHTAGLDKQTAHREAIIGDLTEKLDARMDGLLAKYEDAQKISDEKTAAQEAILNSTKELADELKLSIDTLGTTLAASTESTEKLSQDSKTVFEKVDDVFNKLDETQSGLKGEHEVTRGEIAKAIEGVTVMQSDILEHNPKILVSLKELHALVAQHYEHSQKTATDHTEALKGFDEMKAALPRLMPEDNNETIEGNKVTTSALNDKLDKLLERNIDAPESNMHEKLDKLVAHSAKGVDPTLMEKLEQLSSEHTSPSVQLERLDAIHAQMMATAAEVTAFVATQTQRIADEHTSRETEAEELALLIEKRQAKKEHLEEEISTLTTAKTDLQGSVTSLREEQDSLASEKSRLTADIHALHAALAIRKEELSAMEAKADALEKRILEGLMDHSRAMLLTKAPRQTPSARTSPRRPKGRDLRIPSSDSNVSSIPPSISGISTVPSLTANIVSQKSPSRQSMARGLATAGPGQERRIMSLGQIHHNAVSGRPSLAAQPTMSLDALKRSQSVRPALSLTGQQPRKSSWSVGGGVPAKRGFTPVGMTDIAEDKENSGQMDESSDTASVVTTTTTAAAVAMASSQQHRSASAGGHSFLSFSDRSESRPGSSGSEGSGFSMSDSAVASLIAGKVRERIEAGELDGDDDGAQQMVLHGVQAVDYADKPGHHHHQLGLGTPADSGLGSDLPTAALGSEFGGYFPGGGKELVVANSGE